MYISTGCVIYGSDVNIKLGIFDDFFGVIIIPPLFDFTVISSVKDVLSGCACTLHSSAFQSLFSEIPFEHTTGQGKTILFAV